MKRPHGHRQLLHRCLGADADEDVVVRLPLSGLACLVRTRMLGGVGAGRESLQATRLDGTLQSTVVGPVLCSPREKRRKICSPLASVHAPICGASAIGVG